MPQVVDGLSKLSQDEQASPEVRRLKVPDVSKTRNTSRVACDLTSLRRDSVKKMSRCCARWRLGSFWCSSRTCGSKCAGPPIRR